MTKCIENIRGRKCTREATQGDYCHQHYDRTLYARVGRKCGLSKGVIDGVVAALIEEMSWDEIQAFNHELARGQAEDDAGGFFLRAFGKLIGARGRYDHIAPYKRAVAVALSESKGGE